MTQQEALKQVLEAITQYLAESPDPSEEAVEGLCDAASAARKALAQPEQICGFDVVIDELMPPDTFKLAQPEQEPDIWVLTSEYNDDDQHGEYFEAVFIGKPTSEQIQKHCRINEEGAVRILSGGGRVKNEYLWYNLQKTQAAHGIKE